MDLLGWICAFITFHTSLQGLQFCASDSLGHLAPFGRTWFGHDITPSAISLEDVSNDTFNFAVVQPASERGSKLLNV